MDGLAEIDAIDGRCDHGGAAMTKGRDRRALVHHGHDHAAEDVAHVVGVAGHHQLRSLVLAILYRLLWAIHRWQIYCVLNSKMINKALLAAGLGLVFLVGCRDADAHRTTTTANGSVERQ